MPKTRGARATLIALTVSWGLTCALLRAAPQEAAPQEAAPQEAVLDLEGAAKFAERFLGWLRDGEAEKMYARLDGFTRLRLKSEDFAAQVATLLRQYGAVKSMKPTSREDGNPFFHLHFEVVHEKATVDYHLALTPGGEVVRFEVDAVDGKKLATPDQPQPATERAEP